MADKNSESYAYLNIDVGEGRELPADKKFIDRILVALHNYNLAGGGRGFLRPTGEAGKAAVNGQISAEGSNLRIVLQEIDEGSGEPPK